MPGPIHIKEPTVRRVRRVRLQARHEAIDDNAWNANHWLLARSSGPNVPAHHREKLRNKTRHERENNPSLQGILEQYSGEFIGSGPRLQIIDEAAGSESWTSPVERLFADWAQAVNLAEKLAILVECEPVDGESFLQLLDNPGLDSPVKLDLRNLEAEQVATPDADAWSDPTLIDGIVQDPWGNVVAYHVLHEHPGDSINWNAKYDVLPAETICHWFRPLRAGQGRGQSAFASSVEICAAVRRYAKATLLKQELGANIAASMEVDAPLHDGEPAEFELMDVVPIPNQGMLAVPKGSNPKMFDPAQNTTGYNEFVDKSLTTAGRPVLAPRNLVTGDSSGFNFASGKLDHLPWQASLYRKRERLRHRVLAKILRAWYAEALLAGVLPPNTPHFAAWQYDFQYDGFLSIDPVKDLDAAERRIRLGISTLAIEAALEGYNWRHLARQRAEEVRYLKSLGLSPDASAPAAARQPQPNDEADEDTTLENASRGGVYV